MILVKCCLMLGSLRAYVCFFSNVVEPYFGKIRGNSLHQQVDMVVLHSCVKLMGVELREQLHVEGVLEHLDANQLRQPNTMGKLFTKNAPFGMKWILSIF